MHNSTGVQSKRGCTLNCSYCTYLLLNKQEIRLRRPAHLVDENELMAWECGTGAFTFVDHVFNIPLEHAWEICRELIGRKVAVEWSAWLTLKGLMHELLLPWEEAGCRWIRFSPDAATDRGLAAFAKECTARDIGKSIRLFSNIKTYIHRF